jgi:hypothetical protein
MAREHEELVVVDDLVEKLRELLAELNHRLDDHSSSPFVS